MKHTGSCGLLVKAGQCRQKLTKLPQRWMFWHHLPPFRQAFDAMLVLLGGENLLRAKRETLFRGS